ncbi:putative C2H2 type zinc-finger-domain-containing protein [Seiridium cardinale]
MVCCASRPAIVIQDGLGNISEASRHKAEGAKSAGVERVRGKRQERGIKQFVVGVAMPTETAEDARQDFGATSISGDGSGASDSPARLLSTSNNQPPFVAEQCLFCNKNSEDFESNTLHMQTSHGLFIPDKQHLIVDLEVLIEYMHLVIYGHHECICCGTQRNSTLAVQQHMVGKIHCRFDIATEDSEFADFWDFSDLDSEEAESSDGSSSGNERTRRKGIEGAVQPDEGSLRLTSGKLISKNSASQQHQRRTEARKQRAAIEAANQTASQADDSVSSTALVSASSNAPSSITRSERREQAFTTQLARLGDNDRRSLMHLPASEQRAILATQQKQADKMDRLERRYRSRIAPPVRTPKRNVCGDHVSDLHSWN